jgi:hypothetical protein
MEEVGRKRLGGRGWEEEVGRKRLGGRGWEEEVGKAEELARYHNSVEGLVMEKRGVGLYFVRAQLLIQEHAPKMTHSAKKEVIGKRWNNNLGHPRDKIKKK